MRWTRALGGGGTGSDRGGSINDCCHEVKRVMDEIQGATGGGGWGWAEPGRRPLPRRGGKELWGREDVKTTAVVKINDKILRKSS